MEPHVIPYETEVRPPLPHPYGGRTCNVPLLQRYNIINRLLKYQNQMANHTKTFSPTRQLPTSSPKYMVHKKGEYWAHMNKTTEEVTIRTGQTNAVIWPETGKYQEYRHLMKVPDKQKWKRTSENEIKRLSQGTIDIEGTDTCLFIHMNKVPQARKINYSHIVCNITPQKE